MNPKTREQAGSISQAVATRRPAGFLPVRGEATGKLLFYFDGERGLIEIRVNGQLELVDLRRYIPERPLKP